MSLAYLLLFIYYLLSLLLSLIVKTRVNKTGLSSSDRNQILQCDQINDGY